MNKCITYLTIITAAYSFNAMTSETTPLLKDSKQEIVAYDYLNEVPLPVQLHILEYIATDSEDSLKTIKAMAKTNKHFHTLCSNLEPLSNSRSPKLEKLLAQHLRLTPKNAKKIIEIAQKNNDQITMQKAYKKMDYQSDCLDTCQDCCICTVPWCMRWPEEEEKWNEICQENYTKRIKQKYGIASSSTLEHGNYEEYKKSRKYYLGTGIWLLMCSARTATQLIFCPLCCVGSLIAHDCCHDKYDSTGKRNFEEGKTFYGWLFFPCTCCVKGVFE
ncbi:MAG: hypothetical protein AB7R69_04000 [Candidatus Babeliales bacterium]